MAPVCHPIRDRMAVSGHVTIPGFINTLLSQFIAVYANKKMYVLLSYRY